ncbi:MAG: hypothetical protein CMJ75_13690 [Planctomycetaceae bacterium]|nr:hypothetical protein [Planctomycetaceae bacterium]
MADETHDEDSVPEEELKDESTDRSEEKPAKKKRKRRSSKKPREVEADSESPDGAVADDEVSESNESDGEKSGADGSDGEEAAKVEEPPPPPPEPDDPTAVQALKDLGARLETNEEGNVWRVFFYEDHTDADVTKMHSLNSLKQVWVIGSKATPECVTQLREQFPNATVYA